jgi:YbbR domain-containing protein
MLRGTLDFLTRDWLNKVLALGLAVIIFLVVDDKITDEEDVRFQIRFGRPDRQELREPTIYLALEPDYTATVVPPPGQEGGRTTVSVRFTGPRQLIEDIRQKGVNGNLTVNRTIPDEKTDEDVWTIVGSQIRFSGVDPAKVQIEIPDLQIRVLRLETRYVAVVADLDWFTTPPGYRKGEPQPTKNTVRVTCPKKYIDFDTVRLRPVDEDARAGEDKRELAQDGSKRLFAVVRPPSVPANVAFEADPAEMDVTIPLVPVNDKMDIEVPIVLMVPADGSLGPEIPKTDKMRETFTFIGPQKLLKRCKEYEGTDREIQAVIDLSRLGNALITELKREGIRVKPTFFFPDEETRRQITCEQPKVIWVTPPRSKDE